METRGTIARLESWIAVSIITSTVSGQDWRLNGPFFFFVFLLFSYSALFLRKKKQVYDDCSSFESNLKEGEGRRNVDVVVVVVVWCSTS